MERKESVGIKEGEEMKDVSLKDLSKRLEEFAKERDWEQYHSPRNLLLAMVCLLIDISQWLTFMLVL